MYDILIQPMALFPRGRWLPHTQLWIDHLRPQNWSQCFLPVWLREEAWKDSHPFVYSPPARHWSFYSFKKCQSAPASDKAPDDSQRIRSRVEKLDWPRSVRAISKEWQTTCQVSLLMARDWWGPDANITAVGDFRAWRWFSVCAPPLWTWGV